MGNSPHIAIVEGQYTAKVDDKTTVLKNYKTAFSLTTEQAQAPLSFIKRNRLVELFLQRKGIAYSTIYKRNLLALYRENEPLAFNDISPRWLGQNQIINFLSTLGITLDKNLYVSLSDLRQLVIEYQQNPFDKKSFYELLKKKNLDMKASDEVLNSAILSDLDEDQVLKQFDTLTELSQVKTHSNEPTPIVAHTAKPTISKRQTKPVQVMTLTNGKKSPAESQVLKRATETDSADSLLG